MPSASHREPDAEMRSNSRRCSKALFVAASAPQRASQSGAAAGGGSAQARARVAAA